MRLILLSLLIISIYVPCAWGMFCRHEGKDYKKGEKYTWIYECLTGTCTCGAKPSCQWKAHGCKQHDGTCGTLGGNYKINMGNKLHTCKCNADGTGSNCRPGTSVNPPPVKWHCDSGGKRYYSGETYSEKVAKGCYVRKCTCGAEVKCDFTYYGCKQHDGTCKNVGGKYTIHIRGRLHKCDCIKKGAGRNCRKTG